MASKNFAAARAPIVVARRWIIPHDDTIGALCAANPLPRYLPSDPVERAPSTPADGSRASIFNAIGESLIGDDFAEQTLWWL